MSNAMTTPKYKVNTTYFVIVFTREDGTWHGYQLTFGDRWTAEQKAIQLMEDWRYDNAVMEVCNPYQAEDLINQSWRKLHPNHVLPSWVDLVE